MIRIAHVPTATDGRIFQAHLPSGAVERLTWDEAHELSAALLLLFAEQDRAIDEAVDAAVEQRSELAYLFRGDSPW